MNQDLLGLSAANWAVIAAYLVLITVIGVWALRRVKDAPSFFISDRKFGKVLMMFYTFGTGTHSDQAVSVAAKTYRAGASGIWYQWLWLFATPFYWVLAPLFRRMRSVTTADYFLVRYGRSVALLFAIIGMLQLMVNIGVMLKGSSEMISAVSGGAIAPGLAILGMAVLFTLYGLAGGLNAAILTDFVQGLLTIVLSFLILPFALDAVGGIAGLRATVNDPVMFEIVAPGEITAFYIFIISLNGLIGWVTQPHNLSLCAAGRTEMEGRVGVVVGILVKRVCTIAWVLTGLCAVGLYLGREGMEADHVFGLMARDLLPAIAPGLVGLFIASMLAAVMSSCDAFMITASALFTENIYRPHLAPGRSEKHYIGVGRIVAAVVVMGGIFFSTQFASVVDGLEIFWKVMAMMGIPFWAGLFWRRATGAGAWASTLAAFVVLLFTSRIDLIGWDFNASMAYLLPEFMCFEGALSLPWQMILYLAAGFIACIMVSLFTRPENPARLDRFYTCLRTPVRKGEPEVPAFTLPEGVEPAERKVLIDHPDFEIMKPSFTSVVGFLAAWAAVVVLIFSFFWILKG
ncbi:MAG: sodium:solute symporter family protein [Planctomycetota bacterium]|jgi:Na+/proline symporter